MKTQIGLPVQFFGNTPNGRETFAAIILDLRDYPHAETDLVVFDKTNNPTSFHAQRIRHKDFKKDGENYWDFLEEPLTKNDVLKEETITLSSSEYEKLIKCEKFVNTFLAKFDGDEMFFKPFDTGMDFAYYLLEELMRKEKPVKVEEPKSEDMKADIIRKVYLIITDKTGKTRAYGDTTIGIRNNEYENFNMSGIQQLFCDINRRLDDKLNDKLETEEELNDKLETEEEKTEDILENTPEDRKQKVCNALKKVKQWMSLMNRINNDYNRLSTAIVLITNEVDVTEQDVLDICTELYYKCKLEKFNTVLSEAVFISEFSKMKIDQLKEAKEALTKKDSSDIEIAKYTKSDLRMAFASGIDFAVVNDGLELTSKFRDMGFDDFYCR
jgi:hypothetical protein